MHIAYFPSSKTFYRHVNIIAIRQNERFIWRKINETFDKISILYKCA